MYGKVYFMKLHKCVYLRSRFEFSNIILTSFRQEVILPPPSRPLLPWHMMHDTFWHVVSTGYVYGFFYEPLLFRIFVPWKFIKTYAFPCLLSLLQSTYKYIYLCQTLYSMKSVFLLKSTLKFWPRFFVFQFNLKVKHRSCSV